MTPPLISSAPLLDLLARYDQEAAVLRHWSTSESTAAVVEQVVRDLANALKAASETEAFISLQQAATVAGEPLSTLRRRCSKSPKTLGASKRGRSWMIHLPTFQQYLSKTTPGEEKA